MTTGKENEGPYRFFLFIFSFTYFYGVCENSETAWSLLPFFFLSHSSLSCAGRSFYV